MTRYGIVVDLNRCVGCMTCVINCKEENLTRPGVWWNQILQVENEATDRITYVRYACMHCDDPPCAKACPNQAIYKRADGIILVDKEKCAGVGECMKACPYDVIIMTPDKDYFLGESNRPTRSPRPAPDTPPGQGLDVHPLLPPDRPGSRTGVRGRLPVQGHDIWRPGRPSLFHPAEERTI